MGYRSHTISPCMYIGSESGVKFYSCVVSSKRGGGKRLAGNRLPEEKKQLISEEKDPGQDEPEAHKGAEDSCFTCAWSHICRS